MQIPTNRELNGRLLYLVFTPAGPDGEYDAMGSYTDPGVALDAADRFGGIVVQALAVLADPREEQE